MNCPCLKEHPRGTLLSLKIQPRSSRNQVVGLQASALKIKLTAPPVDGAANRMCLEFIAKEFGLPRSAVVLVSGAKARQKTLLLENLAVAQVDRIIGHLLDTQGRG